MSFYSTVLYHLFRLHFSYLFIPSLSLYTVMFTYGASRHQWSRRQQIAYGIGALSIIFLVLHAVSNKYDGGIQGRLAKASWAGSCISSQSNSYTSGSPNRLTVPGLGITAVDRISHSTTVETTLTLPNPPPGFAIFDRIYLRNKTFYAVTSKPEVYPPLVHILSQPKDSSMTDIDPTDQVRKTFHTI